MRIFLRITCITLFISTLNINAQVGIGTTTPDNSAILDISSSTQGLLTPRMTTIERLAVSNPANGLLVYDTDESAFYFYSSSAWAKLSTGSSSSSNDYTGWADYTDGTYTSASPLSLTAGNKITLPNDAATVRDAQIPIDITEFYDVANQVITGRNGDGININIMFKARPTTNSLTNRITVAIDIGGAVGEIYIRDFLLSKGQNVEHYYVSSFNAYTLNTWEANGGAVKISSTADAEVYDIRYVITRTHKAR